MPHSTEVSHERLQNNGAAAQETARCDRQHAGAINRPFGWLKRGAGSAAAF
jgi:hypothetical protein